MEYLTRYEIVEKIVGVLGEFNKFLQDNRRYFSRDDVLSMDASASQRIIRDKRFMRNMLKKLDKCAIVEMYKDCGALANKYGLRSIGSGYNEVGLKEATIEDDVYNFDMRGLSFYMGFEHQAPQALCGYANCFDTIANEIGFNIHATRFVIGRNMVLRLWKGFYGGVIGGEIGFYGRPETIKSGEMKQKLYETINQFLALIRIQADVGKLMDKSPEELKRELICLLLSSDRIRDNNDQPLNGQDDIRNRIMEALLSPDQFFLKLTALQLLIPIAMITFLIIMNRTINLIVGIKKVLIELNDDNREFSADWGKSLTPDELGLGLGLTGTAMQVFLKRNGGLIAEHEEYGAEYWTTSFALNLRTVAEFYGLMEVKNRIYTVNHFYFKNKECADYFYNEIKKPEIMDEAYNYPDNKSEIISIPDKPNDTTVIILYGK